MEVPLLAVFMYKVDGRENGSSFRLESPKLVVFMVVGGKFNSSQLYVLSGWKVQH